MTLSFSEPNQLAMLEITPEALSTALIVTDLPLTLAIFALALDVGPPELSVAFTGAGKGCLTALILDCADDVLPEVRSDARIPGTDF